MKMYLITVPSVQKEPKRFITDGTSNLSDKFPAYVVESLDFIPDEEPINIFDS